MLPFRGFDIVSNAPTASGTALSYTFPTRTQNFTRAAIIGMSFLHNSAAQLAQLLLTALTRFEIAGRAIKQGNDFAVGLLASGAEPIIAGTQQSYRRSYFPGMTLPLADGTFCSGVKLEGREPITVALTKLTAGAADLGACVLHCLEFPRKAYPAGIQSRIDQLWDRFRAGIGQFHCVGNTLAVVAGAAAQSTLQALVNPPYTQRARRRELRALGINSTGNSIDEAQFVTLTLNARGSTDTAHANIGVPARLLAGHANLHHSDRVQADFERDETSLVDVIHPGGGANNFLLNLATLFEGVDSQGVKVCGPSVF